MPQDYFIGWAVYGGAAVFGLVLLVPALRWLPLGPLRFTLWLMIAVIALLPWPLTDPLVQAALTAGTPPPEPRTLYAPAVAVVFFSALFEGPEQAVPPALGIALGCFAALVLGLLRGWRRRVRGRRVAAADVPDVPEALD